jgi:hypothetical protein
MAGRLTAVWGVLGVVGLLSQALLRLTPLAIDALRGGLTPVQWVVLIVWVLLNAHAEGYRGFHRRFSPRVIARAQHLAEHHTPLRVVFAPLFCMSLFGASRRGKIVARSVTSGIIVLVLIVRALDQPWRGIIDAGVVVGLGLGMLSLLYFAVRAVLGHPPAIDPDLADGEAEPTGAPAGSS